MREDINIAVIVFGVLGIIVTVVIFVQKIRGFFKNSNPKEE